MLETQMKNNETVKSEHDVLFNVETENKKGMKSYCH